jgi:hypothetical protein
VLHYTLDIKTNILKNYTETIQRENPYEMWILDVLKLVWYWSALPVILVCLFPSYNIPSSRHSITQLSWRGRGKQEE